MLDGWLDWQRSTFLTKCAGLTGEQLATRSTPPSTLSLQGLIRHLTEVETTWILVRFLGEDIPRRYSRDGSWDPGFDDIDPAKAEAEYAELLATLDRCRAAIVDADLDATFVSERHGEMSLRWIVIHRIEEYARHNGHADLLRERIDGVTGD